MGRIDFIKSLRRETKLPLKIISSFVGGNEDIDLVRENIFIFLRKELASISAALEVGSSASPYTQITHPINHWLSALYKYHPVPVNNLAKYS